MERKNILISYYGFEQDELSFKAQDAKFMARFGAEVANAAKAKPLDPELRKKIWRPSVGLACQQDLHFDIYYLLYNIAADSTNKQIAAMEEKIDILKKDIEEVCPGIKVHTERLEFSQTSAAWNIIEVYTRLYNLFQDNRFRDKSANYYVNCNHGTMQVRESLFLLTQQGRIINAKRILVAPWINLKKRDTETKGGEASCSVTGSYSLEDPQEFKAVYDGLFWKKTKDSDDVFRKGIMTDNKKYDEELELIKQVALKTRDPILFTGATGSGKTRLAHNIATMRSQGPTTVKFVRANCAAFCGDPGLARSQLFGYSAHAFSGAGDEDHTGLLEKADGGILFLDEIGELPKEVQAMLLTALENDSDGKKHFQRMGDGKEITSDFMLICGTNHDLWDDVEKDAFRQDLLERISIWHFTLPTLAERRKEDLKINLKFALKSFIAGRHSIECNATAFTPEAEERFTKFGLRSDVKWEGNFREFNAMVWRMATLAEGDSITIDDVNNELERWEKMRNPRSKNIAPAIPSDFTYLKPILGTQYGELRMDELAQFAYVANVCRSAKNEATACRALYESRTRKAKSSDQLHKYLRRLGLSFSEVKEFMLKLGENS